MQYCGESLYKFMHRPAYLKLSAYHKAYIAFDMLNQILNPLRCLHRANYVHGDIKPDNICVLPRKNEDYSDLFSKYEPSLPYKSEFVFTLIDFGIMSKFKVKKANRTYNLHVGNLMYSSHRGL